jgi:membrane protease YdiL (CAAX protease family)
MGSYLVVALLPLAYKGFQNPIALWWFLRHRDQMMPPRVQIAAAQASTILPFISQLAIALVLAAAGCYDLVSATGTHVVRVDTSIVFGAGAGLAWLVLYFLLYRVIRPSRERISQHPILQNGIAFWLGVSLSSAVVEEAWRFCSLKMLANWNAATAVAVTAVVCGVAHGRPAGRFLSATMFGAYAATLAVFSQSLWMTVAAHAVVNIGTIGLVYYLDKTRHLLDEGLNDRR